MSNHLHLVLRNRPDRVELWSDTEVALRWRKLFPHRNDSIGRAANSGGTSVGQSRKTWLPSWTGWVWIERIGWTRCATSVACSGKRQVERARLCSPRRVAHGAGFRARRLRKSRFCKQAARSRALIAAVDAQFDWIQGRQASFRFAGAASDEAPPFISNSSQQPMRASGGEALERTRLLIARVIVSAVRGIGCEVPSNRGTRTGASHLRVASPEPTRESGCRACRLGSHSREWMSGFLASCAGVEPQRITGLGTGA